MSEFQFQKAERHRVPLRMAIGGPAGSGKTYTALVVARAISGSKRVAVLDTEHESASLYADSFDFDTLALTAPFTPERYRLGIKAAVAADYGALVIDSLTHEWAGEGGVLEMVDAAKRQSKNQYTAWAVPSAEHTKLTEAILQAPIPVIATMREKMQYVVEQEAGKRTEIRKVGLQPIQREGMEFEFSVFAEMDMANTLTITKSRYKSLQGKVIPRPGEEFVGLLLNEVERGTSEPSPAPMEESGQDQGEHLLSGEGVGEGGVIHGDSGTVADPPGEEAGSMGHGTALNTDVGGGTSSSDEPASPPPCPKCGEVMLSGEMHHLNGPTNKWICSKCHNAIRKED